MALCLSVFIFAMASAKFNSLIFMALAGTALCWTTIVAHNYFHRRDNWQMYTFNLCMMNFCSWRVSHAMSHHIYPNSYFDLELSMFEPFLCWVPNPYIKSLMMRYISWITEPITYMIAFFLQSVTRWVREICMLTFLKIWFFQNCIFAASYQCHVLAWCDLPVHTFVDLLELGMACVDVHPSVALHYRHC